MSARTSAIYKITCQANGMFYIGSTVDFRRREREHLRKLRSSKHVNPILQNLYNKYGEDSLEFRVIIRSEPELLLVREQAWISRLHPTINVSPYADRPAPRVWTEEAREVAAQRARQMFLGKHHTTPTKRILSEKAKARLQTRGHPLQGKRWPGDRARHASIMRRLHAEGRLIVHAKLYGVSEAQKEKMRRTIAANGGRYGRNNGNYKPEIEAVYAATVRLVERGVSLKDALRTTGLARSTYYKRRDKERFDGGQ